MLTLQALTYFEGSRIQTGGNHLELCHRNPDTFKRPDAMLTSPVIQLNYGEVRTHRLDDSTVSYKKILFTYWLSDLSAR